MKKKYVYIVFAVIMIWLIAYGVDGSKINSEEPPIFCIRTEESASYNEYTGLGYRFETFKNPITGKIEHISYLFGIEVDSNLTN